MATLIGTQIAAGAANPYSPTITVPEGCTTLIAVVDAYQVTSGSVAASYNGSSMTSRATFNWNQAHGNIFTLANPTEGANTLTISWTGPGTDVHVACYFMSGIDNDSQVGDSDSATTGSANNLSVSLTAPTDAFIVDQIVFDNSRTATSASGTKIFPASGGDYSASSHKTASGATTMGYTFSLTGCALHAVAFNNEAGGGGGNIPAAMHHRRMLGMS